MSQSEIAHLRVVVLVAVICAHMQSPSQARRAAVLAEVLGYLLLKPMQIGKMLSVETSNPGDEYAKGQ